MFSLYFCHVILLSGKKSRNSDFFPDKNQKRGVKVVFLNFGEGKVFGAGALFVF